MDRYIADGFLFIGDLHISSKKPGRRKDVDFGATIIGKLREAMKIANSKNYVPVILGDLFNSAKENSEGLKTRTIRALNTANHKPICLVGNHDITHSKLSDEDSLAMLGESGIIELIRETGPHKRFALGEKKVLLGGTPYGQEIPNNVEDLKEEGENIIWLTHHDLAFDGAYPGATELFEIKGCNLVINGHMHLTKPHQTVGTTTWFNPGNITRQSLETWEHIPRVWGFSNKGQIQPIELEYEKNIFNLTGRLSDAIEDTEHEENLESTFVKLLEVESSNDLEKSDDGAIIWEQIQDKFGREGTDPKVQHIVASLLKEVTE